MANDEGQCSQGYGPHGAPRGIAELCLPHHYQETYWIHRYETLERLADGALFRCRLNNNGLAWVSVVATSDDIIRVRFGAGNAGTAKPPADHEFAPGNAGVAPGVVIREEEDAVILETRRVMVRVERSPWRLSISDSIRPAGAFFSEQIEDFASLEFETPPAGFDHDPAAGRWRARETLLVRPDEAFYGFGEKFSRLNKRGQLLTSWTTDTRSIHTQRTYKNVPFFTSSRGYGCFVNSSSQIFYDMGQSSFVSACVTVDAPVMDYFVIRGNSLKYLLRRYSDLTGHAAIPPKWSFGLWMSRLSYRSREEVESVARELRARKIPCDVLNIDPYWMGNERFWTDFDWDQTQFPDPGSMLAELSRLGFRVCLWINPYIPRGTLAFDAASKAGYFVKDASGKAYLHPPWESTGTGPPVAVVDFTNPGACAWYRSCLERLLRAGVATFKTDFGEWAPPDGIYHSGESGEAVHNLYPLLYNCLVYETVRDIHGAENAVVWGRSAFTGSQAMPVIWGGDSFPSFEDMACQLWGGLSLGMSGIPFYGHDNGGFAHQPSPEIYIRWAQFGLLSSHSRCHGVGEREPWHFGEEAEQIFRDYCRLRYRLIPYLYSEAHHSAQTGSPLMRPMVLEFQEDRNTHELDLQYMLGGSLLVAPVFGGEQREFYLPEGIWFEFRTNRLLEGPRWITEAAPLDRIPLYVRGESVIPMHCDVPFVEANEPADQPKLTLRFYVTSSLLNHEYVVHGIMPGPIFVNWQCASGTYFSCALSDRPAWTRLELIGVGAAIGSPRVDGDGTVIRSMGAEGAIAIDMHGTGACRIDLGNDPAR